MNITINQGDLTNVKNMLSAIKNGVPRVLTTAINKTLGNIRAKQIDEVYARYTLKKTRIRKDFKPIKKATWNNLNGKTISTGKPPGLMAFGFKGTKSGVVGSVLRGGSAETLRGAFKAYAKGGQHFFKRHGKSRYPIVRLTGPRIQDALVQPKVEKAVMDRANEQWDKNIEHATTRMLDKLK